MHLIMLNILFFVVAVFPFSEQSSPWTSAERIHMAAVQGAVRPSIIIHETGVAIIRRLNEALLIMAVMTNAPN